MLLRLILMRLFWGVVTLFAVSILITLMVNLLPGDIAQELLGQSATPDTVASLRNQLGLNLPLHERYFTWLWAVLHGDLGKSLANGRPIADLLAARIGNTLFLASVAAVIAIPVSLALGLLTALYRNGAFDRLANIATLSAISLPEFFIAYLLIFFLAVKLEIFPSISNIVDPAISLSERLDKTLLPALTLTLVVAAHIMRMTRTSIINVLASPYIEMARLKGASPRKVITFHALPNAVAPIVNVVALNLAYLVVGVVVVEVVFVYPGMGQLLVDSVAKRDLPVVQASALLFAVIYIVLNLLADIVSMVGNPRVLHPR
ncbi:ABC transporter permease [Mesorhizobium sp. CA8]|uniref:ABC transporter permease n=1 Tax=unclassified Mesorhizobium TaxID=325217 RepID=UPI001CCDAA6C|nr:MULTISPECIES: ABC transporter permease [unclassified Mesorhizobium]MBZ9761665.1 ABC transporter permease [Mesorhizobium sp. CA8]MBZ9820581.1 ABC transporter permease [Mesorhizobium sp. CA4]